MVICKPIKNDVILIDNFLNKKPPLNFFPCKTVELVNSSRNTNRPHPEKFRSSARSQY